MIKFLQKFKLVVIGKSKNPQDSQIFHNLSLMAFFAWVGLGADGLSSSCYGPQEAFLALGHHTYLSIFVALATVITICVISASYSQIVEVFPSGGGGYQVASKLLSPSWGMISGCALLIDYVLTITVSIASGADAVFSLLPPHFIHYKLWFALFSIIVLTLLNMRGVKESVLTLVPIFLVFVFTHVFIIIYFFFHHLPELPNIAHAAHADVSSAVSQIGWLGVIFLILRAYSMGAGTFTGLEAVSNAVSLLREPRVKTAKKTMVYMAVSLSVIVLGLMLAYIVYDLHFVEGKTLNAVLFEKITSSWGIGGYIFVLIALISEATLLFIAAQTGFLGGPRVLANMAVDRWFPTRFSMLSDRLVIQNGVLIMSILALALLIFTHGSVSLLVVFYSINVFITFVLSQLGMVRHWWNNRSKVTDWFKKMLVNGIGLVLTAFILVSMIVLKFNDGGWATLVVTGALIAFAIYIKKHYLQTAKLLKRLNNLVVAAENSPVEHDPTKTASLIKNPDFSAKTAVILVTGFNGMGLHTLFGIFRFFGQTFKNYVFVQVGVIDVENFNSSEEVKSVETKVKHDTDRYVAYIQGQGFYSEGIWSVNVDAVEGVVDLAPQVLKKYPNSVFFGGQLIFPEETLISRFLHNYTSFALQKRLYWQGVPFVILPIRV
ncbi:MAG: APC family permease [Candidatus Omnitrophica bacterium]|nr:APC family permease [Candidatus Omnitrophota bacterium]